MSENKKTSQEVVAWASRGWDAPIKWVAITIGFVAMVAVFPIYYLLKNAQKVFFWGAIEASLKGDAHMLSKHLRRWEINAATDTGQTPLFLAARKGYLDCVRLLIKAGSDVNQCDAEKLTPLMATVVGDHVDCLRALIEAAADVNRGNEKGLTPLALAASCDRVDCLRALIEARANMEALDVKGRSVASAAIGAGKTDSLRALLDAGVDIDGVGFSKNKLNLVQCALVVGQAECLRLLIERGAGIGAASSSGVSWAAESLAKNDFDPECVEILRAAELAKNERSVLSAAVVDSANEEGRSMVRGRSL